MEILSELMLPKGFDVVWGLCTDTITSKIKFAAEQQQINEKLEAYLSRKLKDNWFCTPEEEIDFEGLANYIRENLVSDVETCLCGQTEERKLAREDILEKAVIYASANTTLSRQRAQKMVSDVVEMLKVFWRTQVPKGLRMTSGEIIDDINQNTNEQLQKVDDKLNDLTNEIKNISGIREEMSFHQNAKLLRNGKISEVEENLNITLNGLAGQHALPGLFKYHAKTIGDRYRLVSVPIHPDACKLYPPKIKGIADLKIKEVDKKLWEDDIVDYANRHQLDITMTVRNAEKYLGEIKDPSQAEAEMMKGKDYIIHPKPFPPAFPCSIMGDGNTIVPYLLLRTVDISDDGVYTVTNDEQKGRQFKFTLKLNPKNKKTDFNFSATGFGNRGRLQILKAMKALRECNDIKLYLLEQNTELICGRFNALDLEEIRSMEETISILEQVLDIEKYLHKELPVPGLVSTDQLDGLEYMSELIRGGVCVSTWKSVSCNFTIDEKNKKVLLDGPNMEYTLEFNGTIKFNLWENKLVLPIKRRYVCVKFENYEKIKQKIAVLDIGDCIQVTFVPGSKGDKVEERLLTS